MTDKDKRKKDFLLIGAVLFLLISSMMGCFGGPTPESNWDEVVSSYNYNKNTFEGFEGKVIIGDEVDTIEYIPSHDVSEVTLRSNSVPLYLRGKDVSEVDDSDNDLTNNFNYKEEIIFIIHIEEDKFGEYIKEMTKDGS